VCSSDLDHLRKSPITELHYELDVETDDVRLSNRVQRERNTHEKGPAFE
jgi:hypothetical protein